MKQLKGELDLEVKEILFVADNEWFVGAGHQFTVEGIDFAAIAVPQIKTILLTHYESGVLLSTANVPEDVETFDNIVSFIQNNIVIMVVKKIHEDGVEKVKAEIDGYEKESIDIAGPKPDITLNILKPRPEPPQKYLN